MPKIYFHVDVNSAFLSWSALKALQGGSTVDLRTIPAVVGGDEAKRHGVVLAKSTPAKKFGIRTGESLFAARVKCPGLTVVPPDFDFYVKNSKALIQILNDYTPDVEQYSIDEAFLDMTGTEALFGPPLTAAHTIRRRVRRELGFTVNVGIAPNRLLAKMASDFEKPDRVHTLYKYEVETKMWPLPVGDLFGVGPSAAKRLNSCGIYTIGDLARLERDTAVKLFGSRGDTLWNYANGREADPVTKQRTRDNSYGNSVTMPRDLARPADADATMLALCDSVGRRLRADGKTARVVTVQLVDNAFRASEQQEITILDFGCGKSYLTFILYYYFTVKRGVKATILGYDLKEDVVEHCNAIAQKYGYDGLRFVVSDVTRDTLADTHVDMVVTLHACDTATDYALWYAVEKGVKHIFSVPCCQHEINATIHKGGDFDVLLRHGLLQERFSALLTDSIRAAVLEDMGYTVDVIEFIDFAHSPKNLMLRCVKDRRAGERNLSAARELAEKYGFRQALLELAEKKCHSAQNTAF